MIRGGHVFDTNYATKPDGVGLTRLVRVDVNYLTSSRGKDSLLHFYQVVTAEGSSYRVATRRLLVVADREAVDIATFDAKVCRCVDFSKVEQFVVMESSLRALVGRGLSELDLLLHQTNPLDVVRTVCALFDEESARAAAASNGSSDSTPTPISAGPLFEPVEAQSIGKQVQLRLCVEGRSAAGTLEQSDTAAGKGRGVMSREAFKAVTEEYKKEIFTLQEELQRVKGRELAESVDVFNEYEARTQELEEIVQRLKQENKDTITALRKENKKLIDDNKDLKHQLEQQRSELQDVYRRQSHMIKAQTRAYYQSTEATKNTLKSPMLFSDPSRSSLDGDGIDRSIGEDGNEPRLGEALSSSKSATTSRAHYRKHQHQVGQEATDDTGVPTTPQQNFSGAPKTGVLNDADRFLQSVRESSTPGATRPSGSPPRTRSPSPPRQMGGRWLSSVVHGDEPPRAHYPSQSPASSGVLPAACAPYSDAPGLGGSDLAGFGTAVPEAALHERYHLAGAAPLFAGSRATGLRDGRVPPPTASGQVPLNQFGDPSLSMAGRAEGYNISAAVKRFGR